VGFGGKVWAGRRGAARRARAQRVGHTNAKRALPHASPPTPPRALSPGARGARCWSATSWPRSLCPPPRASAGRGTGAAPRRRLRERRPREAEQGSRERAYRPCAPRARASAPRAPRQSKRGAYAADGHRRSASRRGRRGGGGGAPLEHGGAQRREDEQAPRGGVHRPNEPEPEAVRAGVARRAPRAAQPDHRRVQRPQHLAPPSTTRARASGDGRARFTTVQPCLHTGPPRGDGPRPRRSRLA
jgi:hypothetical protein